MHISRVVYLATLALGAAAQTPPGFRPSTNTNLAVSYGNTTVQPGSLLTKADTALEPTIEFTEAGEGKYVVIMMDLDVVFNGTNTNLVHWIQGDFGASDGSPKLSSSQGPIAPYLSPAPPAGQNHRYVQMLFKEPRGFSIPASFTAIFANLTASVVNRIGFDLNKFIAEAKLDDLVAGNFFRVATANETASATPTSTPATSGTGAKSTGAATSTAPTSSVTSANSGIVGRVLDLPILVGIGMVGVVINVF
ncbi:MAG: hypothetical protein M1840_007061 [Geoglossum simile]|nr:MAG: hypothetical protein M1840_007061 [Geoglossum simile]